MGAHATQQWFETRNAINWGALGRIELHVERSGTDGIRDFIQSSAEKRGIKRVERLMRALEFERQPSVTFTPLCVDRIIDWQRIIEPKAAILRRNVAYAKHGNEQYEYWDGIWESFDNHLAESKDETLPIVSRAARAYLDICFYHPFLDGNGRLALVVLDSILMSKNVRLKPTGPVFKLSRYADDIPSTLHFVNQLAMLCGATV